MMRKNRLFIILLFIFTLSFSSVVFGASGSGSSDSFENLFPLSPNIDYYNDSNSHYLYQFVPDAYDLVDDAFQELEEKINADVNIDDLEYFFYVVDRQTLGFAVWYKDCRPYVTVDVNDTYYQLEFHADYDCVGNNPFCLYFGKIYKSTVSSSSITYNFYETEPGKSRLDSNMRFSTSSFSHVIKSPWNAAFYPIIQKNADIDVQYSDSVFPLFPPSADNDDDIVDDGSVSVPDLPDDTDSNIVTLIKSIASFFSQLFSFLNNLFDDLISDISDLFDNVIEFFSEIFDNISSFFNNIIDNITSFFNWFTDFSVDKNIIKDSSVYRIYDDFRTVSTIFEFSNVPEPDSVVLSMDFSSSDNVLSCLGNVNIDFGWYEHIRDYVVPIVVGFLYIRVLWRIFSELPSLISGHSGNKED